MNCQKENPTTALAHIADEVRTFYDQRPYPPPVKDLDGYGRRWEDPNRRRAEFHLFWPERPYEEHLDILVAGCGTAQAAKHALRHPAARVTGIDVSSTSIRHTEDLKRKYDLTNLEIHQLPVEQAHELEQSFDKIVCTGVLHHLPDPSAGLSVLRDVLKPDGAMHLMVYATFGRTGIYMLQQYCRLLGIGQSDREITDLAHTLMAIPPNHPLAPLLAEVPDFRTKAGLADALIHPLDRAYTVPQLFELIRRAGLTFGRWLRQAPYLPQCGSLAQSPHGKRLAQLSPEEQYGALELFRGTMVRHNVFIYRDDRPATGPSMGFDDEQWLTYVPIRLPESMLVQEGLPPGAVAVLINRNHTDKDLVLPIDEGQKQLFEGIDGKVSIAEIVDSMPGKGRSQDHQGARIFFEQLWWYDQVVFVTYNR